MEEMVKGHLKLWEGGKKIRPNELCKHLKKTYIWISLLLIISSLVIFAVFNKYNEHLAYNPNLDDIEVKQILEKDDNYILDINYPKTGKKNIDEDILAHALQGLDKFKDYSSLLAAKKSGDIYEFSVDYIALRHDKNLVSFYFYKNIYAGSSQNKSEIFTLNYDLSKDQSLALEQLFSKDSGYLSLLSKKCRDILLADQEEAKKYDKNLLNQGLMAKELNFKNFALDSKNLHIYLNYYQLGLQHRGIKDISIPYEQLGEAFLINKGQIRASEAPKIRKPLNNYTPINIKKPMVALTFDDGPNRKTTPLLLEGLKKRNARATFFVLGNRAKSAPEIIRQMADEGHQVASHGYDHVGKFPDMKPEQLSAQLNKTREAVAQAIASEPRLVRPPYGSIDEHTKALIDYPIIMWNVDTRDWKSRDTQKIKNAIVAQARDGDIILLHDIYDTSCHGVLLAIDELQKKGFQFVTVEELFIYKGIDLRPNKVYRHAH